MSIDYDCSCQDIDKIPKDVPHRVRSFFCGNNSISSLNGCPQQVSNVFDCGSNHLFSLKYSPTFVGGNCYINDNPIKSLKYCPDQIGGLLDCSYCHITTLKYLPSYIFGRITLDYNPVVEYGLGLLLVKKLAIISANNAGSFSAAADILNTFLQSKKEALVCTTKQILQCKIELEKAGLGQFAKL